MMMLMKKKKGSLAVMAVLVASVNCVVNPSKEHLSGEFELIQFYPDQLEIVLSCTSVPLERASLCRDLSPGGKVPGQTD